MLAKLKPHHSPLLLILAAVLSLFWPTLLHPDHILVPTFSRFSDTMVIHWPKAYLMAQSWQAGEGLPHWTPLILSGMPLAANQLAMLSYPPAWLFLILPIEPVFNLLFIGHLLLGGFGVYFLLHKAHRLSPGAALLGSLTFALNGKWLAHVAGGHVSMVGAIGWMPWTLFGLHMLLQETLPIRSAEEEQKKSPPYSSAPLLACSEWILLVAISLAMQITTHTLLLIYTVYLLAAIVVWHFGRWIIERTHGTSVGEWPLIVRSHLPYGFAYSLIRLFAIPLLAGLLGATQLLPLLELTRFSNRALSLSEAADFAVSPVQLLIGLFLPSAQGGHELVIYLGLVPLLLVPLGLSRKNHWTWFYGLLFVFTILFALGPSTPVHSLFYHLVPGFRWVRTPARMFFVGAIATAALVGFGVDRLQQVRWSPSVSRWLTRFTVALSGLALMVGLGLAIGFGQMGRAPFALAIFMPVGLSLILLRGQRIISAPLATALLGVILFLDLALFDMSMMRFVPLDEALAPGRPAAEYLAEKWPSPETLAVSNPTQLPGPFRIYSPSYSLPTQTAVAAGLHLADGVEPVHLAIYDQYMARAGGYGDASFSVTIPNFGEGPLESALQETEPNLKLLGLLNVVYLASAFPMDWPGLTLETNVEGTLIYRNEQALPRAWVAHQTIPAEVDWLAQLEHLPNLANVVIVESDMGEAAETVMPGSEAASAASLTTITHYSADSIEIETEITAPGWLVLSEIWYPGWQAIVNGTSQPVEKVDGLLRGLYLNQPGQHQIKLVYRPQSMVWGNWISGLTAGLIILGGVFQGLKKHIS